MQIESKRFGCLEIDPSRILKFPEGLIGFPNCTEYVVIDLEPSGDGLKLLQCQ